MSQLLKVNFVKLVLVLLLSMDCTYSDGIKDGCLTPLSLFFGVRLWLSYYQDNITIITVYDNCLSPRFFGAPFEATPFSESKKVRSIFLVIRRMMSANIVLEITYRYIVYLILGVVLIDNYIYIALSGGVERGTVGFLSDMMENRCQYKNILNHRKLMNRLTHFLNYYLHVRFYLKSLTF